MRTLADTFSYKNTSVSLYVEELSNSWRISWETELKQKQLGSSVLLTDLETNQLSLPVIILKAYGLLRRNAEQSVDEVVYVERTSKYKTVYGVYYLNHERTLGYSNFYDTESAARKMMQDLAIGWSARLEVQTYELEEDSRHSCEDEE